ncbi:E3 ubiquitin-protein ligase RNF34 isoform X5 [Engystomops pustulosus]|uniref:E3 ubiquitin-protein ligase RNF34 isoform X5 n=1 Tax=Engystomops pustulosus TaxID=76066 RepID=UPI003AFB10E0
MKAGASSMWASCCGLLNEVMGTGAVRGQQSGFGGAGPFRFAQSADFSPYPSSSSNIVCKACGLNFTVFRKKGTSETISITSDTETPDLQANDISKKQARASLSDLSTEEEIEGLTIRQLKEILARNFVNYSGCCEKWELVEKVSRLYRENEENRKSMESIESRQDSERDRLQLTGNDDNLCRICMDAVIDCVLLECGHMVTCTKCGKRMSECPICRQYVVRAVHVFKS